MYLRGLGAASSATGAVAPYINTGGKSPFATLARPRHGFLQGLGALTQAGFDAATKAGAPGFYGDPATWPGAGPGQVQIWWSAPSGATYYKAVPQGSIPQMPNGGAVYTYAQAGASAASGRDPNSGFVQVPSILINGQPVYASVYVPTGSTLTATGTTPPPPPPLSDVFSIRTGASSGVPAAPSGSDLMIPASATTVAPVTQGPMQSSIAIAPQVSPLPTPALPFMDSSGAAVSNAVAASVNGQGVAPVPVSVLDTGGLSIGTLLLIGLGVYLIARR